MKELLKRVLRSAPVRWTMSMGAAGYIAFVHHTSRWQHANRTVPEAFWRDGRPFIIAFWHGRLLMMPYCWPRRAPIVTLISRHRDGDVIAGALSCFGFGAVRGSTAKGGAASLMVLARQLKNGCSVAITPDGPRGPQCEAAPGIAALASLTGVPVIACAVSSRRRRRFKSWDRFIFCLPFTRGVYVWGEPVVLEPGLRGDGLERGRLRIEAELRRVTAEADRLTGHEPDSFAPACARQPLGQEPAT